MLDSEDKLPVTNNQTFTTNVVTEANLAILFPVLPCLQCGVPVCVVLGEPSCTGHRASEGVHDGGINGYIGGKRTQRVVL